MCGINGFIKASGDHTEKINRINAMNRELTHRGPDDEGSWSHDETLYFGHRRLSILDLSELGHQPMLSASGKSVIILNGEIYNFKELRNELKQKLRGQSDTEVLVEYIEQFGLEKALQNIRGMYAFAYFSKPQNELSLVRDPFGEKPLYYGYVQDNFYFSSELKAIAKVCTNKLELDENSLVDYLRYNYVPSPQSIYKGLYKLAPGHYIQFKLDSVLSEPKCFFQTKRHIETSKWTDESVLNEVHKKLSLSIKRQMISDVPLGVFLSSGIDSSLIAALMQEQSMKPIQSFTIGFDSEDYDESPTAGLIAEQLGLEHTEYECSSQDLLKEIPHLSRIYDEPFADSSQIPTLLLSQITQKKVSVALSGDGGDEVFGGYNRYQWLQKAHQQLRFLPKSLYKLLELAPLPYVANKVDKLRHISRARNLSEAYELVIQNQHDPKLHPDLSNEFKFCSDIQTAEDMMIEDQKRYLPDDILVKVDRASMSTSLETRAPYLDIDLYSYVAELPMNYKIRNRQTKWPLRNLLKSYIPEKLTHSPKKGFAVPIDNWLRNELKEWATDLLSEERLKKQQYLNSKVVHQYLVEHLSGEKNRQFELWNLLVFQSWLDSWQ